MRRRIALSVMLAALCITVLTIIIINQKETAGVSRILVFRQAAIVLGYDEEAEYENFFTDCNDWFVPYINYMFEKGYIDKEITLPDSKNIVGEVSKEEIIIMLEDCKGDFEDEKKHERINELIADVNASKKVDYQLWNKILDMLIIIYDRTDDVLQEEMNVFATPASIHELDAWNAVTDKGVIKFEGFAVDSFMDSKINVLYCGDYILKLEPVEKGALYENVIIYEREGRLIVQLKGYEREFAIDTSIGCEGYVLADVNISDNDIKKIVLKNERISGKINTIKDNLIDIDGYGTLELHENVHIFKSFGETAEMSEDELFVGYNVYEFVVAENKICGIYMVREADAEKIRVIISSSDYNSLYHDEISCTSDSGLQITCGSETIMVASGESFNINKESPYFNEGKIKIEAINNGKILFTNITRKTGNPTYPGSMELSLTGDGILIINEVYLEDYLKLVLPSEMPSTYSLEALKAQAVCARSYAYRQIKGNAYAELGAHVDDTTSFQVYNNAQPNDNANRAVDETYGKVLLYNGEPVTTYYYSTSWGYSTDVSVWGNDVLALPYLAGVKLSDAEDKDVTSNTVFETMIKNKEALDWEKECPWYRWYITWNTDELSNIINQNIGNYSMKHIDEVEVKQADESFTAEFIDDIGIVSNIDVLERGTGGVVKRLLLEGSKETVVLNSAGAVRNILGSKDSVYTKSNDETTSGHQYLPSAYFIIEQAEGNTFKMTGGGFGHGVGMSQNGANEMAKQGKGYEEILESFYPGTNINDVE